MSLVVVALGGNALLRRGEPLDADAQRANAAIAARAIAAIARDRKVVLTHGNGPQVGLLALQNESYSGAAPYPFDVLGAETEGMVGYLLGQELSEHVPAERLATLLTNVIVDADDDAFTHPTKPIGPVYDKETALRLARQRGWAVAADGAGWRRVVASPEPRAIVELTAIRLLVEHGLLVTCVGGGGIPVTRATPTNGRLHGIEAVIDKDLAAALLADQLGAEALILLTDVDGVHEGWGTPSSRLLAETTPSSLRALELPAGSMGPKAEAACRFVESGGAYAAIGSLVDALAVARGDAGTVVRLE
jgi:carbamate kinase